MNLHRDNSAFAYSPAETGENDIGLPIVSQRVADEPLKH
jgi:hypothetical protein